MKYIFVLFSDLDHQTYTFSRKIESTRTLIWNPRTVYGTVYTTVYTF